MVAAVAPQNDDDWSLVDHIRQVYEEQSRLQAARYGHPEDPDRALAHLILRLLRNKRAAWGTLLANHRRRLDKDRRLAVYLASVIAGGDAAISEARRAARDISSTAAQFPVWRRWGQILMDAGAADDLDMLLQTTESSRQCR